MISIQAFRISVGLFQFKFRISKPKNSTYADISRDNRGNRGKKNSLMGGKLGFNLKIILLFFQAEKGTSYIKPRKGLKVIVDGEIAFTNVL